MSAWTHVAGIIRLNDFRHLSGSTKESVLSAVLSDIPIGSEGPLSVKIVENPNKSHIAAYDTMVFGDLRGHESPDPVIDWFKALHARLRIESMPHVRQAIIHIDVEYGEKLVVIADIDEVTIVKVGDGDE